MKIADPERGFRKMQEDIRRRREQQEATVTQPQQQSMPINNNYTNYNPKPLQDDSGQLQSQINNLQQQINTLQKPQPQSYYTPIAPIQQPPAPLPVQQPVQQVINKPKEQVSLTGIGFITLFLTGIMAYMYKIDTFIQGNIDKFITETSLPITPTLIFGGIAVIGICLIIAGVFKR